ncbi:MAG: molecular chaperone DnaK [Candidatus Aminicenantes bacterium]|nr:molecular chaperone DnaK [Candidatus Aminicenantes bacterium]
MGHIIGIDLGTTFSCVAYLEGQRPLVISNLEGARTTPSVVSFTTAGERLVGNLALRQAITNPEHTVFAVKRLIGRKFDSPEIVAARKRVGFEMVAASNGDIQVRIDDKVITPQEISGIILRYLRQCAEQHFGEPITEAVVTVPAHFNDLQRQATKDAAHIAGLEVLRVINEPTAASLAYGLDTKKNATVAVFDMGGGTFDFTLLEIQDGVFQVLSTNGDSFLGGEDFDNRIVEWLVEEFWKEERIDLTQDKLALQRIKEAAERAKRELSFTLESEINLPFICSAKASSLHIKKILSRSKLEELTEDLVRKTLPCIEGALDDARILRNKIDDIILVGGQTRMPLIKTTIAGFFGKPPIDNVNADEIVAMGAAIQSGILGGTIDDLVLLLDVTAFSLGIETENDTFETIIERNTTIPTKVSKSFTTVEHNQRQVRIHVLQGESKEAHENRPLAIFYLMGIEPAPAGVPQIDVTFEIDADGLVRVHARDKVSGSEHRVEVRPSSGLTRSELQSIIEQHKTPKAE